MTPAAWMAKPDWNQSSNDAASSVFVVDIFLVLFVGLLPRPLQPKLIYQVPTLENACCLQPWACHMSYMSWLSLGCGTSGGPRLKLRMERTLTKRSHEKAWSFHPRFNELEKPEPNDSSVKVNHSCWVESECCSSSFAAWEVAHIMFMLFFFIGFCEWCL